MKWPFRYTKKKINLFNTVAFEALICRGKRRKTVDEQGEQNPTSGSILFLVFPTAEPVLFTG